MPFDARDERRKPSSSDVTTSRITVVEQAPALSWSSAPFRHLHAWVTYGLTTIGRWEGIEETWGRRRLMVGGGRRGEGWVVGGWLGEVQREKEAGGTTPPTSSACFWAREGWWGDAHLGDIDLLLLSDHSWQLLPGETTWVGSEGVGSESGRRRNWRTPLGWQARVAAGCCDRAYFHTTPRPFQTRCIFSSNALKDVKFFSETALSFELPFGLQSMKKLN